MIVVEEAHNYNKNPYSPSPILRLVAREGRGRGLSLWFITQRIQDFPKLLWSQCYMTYLLKFTIPQDIRYVSALIPDFDKINRELRMHDVTEVQTTRRANTGSSRRERSSGRRSITARSG